MTGFRSIAALVFGGWFLAAGAVSAAEVAAVRQIEIPDRKLVFATIQALDRVAARVRTGGTVATLAVDEGDAVAAGGRIAFVEDPKLALRIAALDALIAAQASERDLAATTLERARTLVQRGTATQARLDDARAAFQVAAARLAATRAEREVLMQERAEGEILAPRAGRVLAVHVTEGTVVLPGEAVADIATGALIARLSLPERHARFLAVGETVAVGRRALAGSDDGPVLDERPGRVVKIYPRLENGRVLADVEAPGLSGYFVGERIPVTLATGRRPALIVPREAVSRRFGIAYVTLEDGTEITVEPGRPLPGGMLEVLTGLRPGDRVRLP